MSFNSIPWLCIAYNQCHLAADAISLIGRLKHVTKSLSRQAAYIVKCILRTYALHTHAE